MELAMVDFTVLVGCEVPLLSTITETLIPPLRVSTTQIGDWGRYITEVTVDYNDPNHVVVTLGNYGNQNYVYRSTTAATTGGTGSFNSIQGNLPRMPVYSAAIDYYNSNNIIVGTEMGLFPSTGSGNVWEPDMNGIPHAAITTLVKDLVDEEGCYSLYEGTYGRGIYQSANLTPAGCATFTGNDKLVFEESNFGVYPNPASTATKVSFSLSFVSKVVIDVYSISGKKVLSQNLGLLMAGGHIVSLDVSGLHTGHYVVMITGSSNARLVEKMAILD